MSGERIETAGEYTPTTDCVRDVYVAWTQGVAPGARLDVRVIAAEFDRWFAQVTAEAEARGAREALLSAADVIESADVYDVLSRPDARGVYWREDCVVDAVEHSGPIADWLRARTEQTGADQ